MISIKELNKSYGNKTVFNNLSVDFPDGKITAILGPSGCGKTTLLNIIAGLLAFDSGEISYNNNEIKANTNSINNKMRISYVFQEPRLLEWVTVYENINFVLKDILFDQEKRHSTIMKNLEQVDMGSSSHLYPEQLSGGMMQRVAIARAYAYPGELLLMDEPFKSLDLEIKSNLIETFARIQSINKRTVIFVTHDIQSACILGDQIAILSRIPTQVCDIVSNPISKEKRNRQNDELFQLEKQLYSYFIV